MTTTFVHLISPSANFKAILEPSKHILDPHAGLVVTEKAKVVEFIDGRTKIPSEWLPALEAHSSFAGSATAPKMIWLADEALAPGAGGERVGITKGAITVASRRPAQAPLDGWDAMPAKTLISRLGEVKYPTSAFLWESEHKRRATVLMALTKHITKAGPADEEEPDEVEDVPDVMGAPAPDEEE